MKQLQRRAGNGVGHRPGSPETRQAYWVFHSGSTPRHEPPHFSFFFHYDSASEAAPAGAAAPTECADVTAPGSHPGKRRAILLPLSKIWSNLVATLPSVVISYLQQMGRHQQQKQTYFIDAPPLPRHTHKMFSYSVTSSSTMLT